MKRKQGGRRRSRRPPLICLLHYKCIYLCCLMSLHVSVCIFLCISVYVRAYPQLSKNDSPRNLLPNRAIESFWDALWLELWPFLYFD